MNIQRRLLLKSMVLGGISSLGVVRTGMVLADGPIDIAESIPILLLVNEETRYSVFCQGVQAAVGQGSLQVCITDLGTGFLSLLQDHIRSGQGRRIVGLVDDASGTLIVDLARTAGVRMHWLGQHTTSLNQSRHRLLSSQAAGDREALFGYRLVAQSTGEEAVSSYGFVSYSYDGIDATDQQWAAELGFMLVATGQITSALPRVAGLAPLTGHFISFAFEI